MEPKANNSFCYYPFTALAVKRWVQGKFSPFPCCNSGHLLNAEWESNFPKDITLDEAFHSKPMNDLRQDMLANRKPDICGVCWRREKHYGSSPRLHSAHILKGNTIDIHNPQLQVLDIGTGNTCNLRCRMCTPFSSSELMKDRDQFVERNVKYWRRFPYTDEILKSESINKFDKNNEDWTSIFDTIQNYTYIKASGGETLLSNQFIDFLQKCIDEDHAQNIILQITTNATQLTKPNIERLKKFKALEFIFSIDGIDKIYEYIRYPQSFDKLERSIDKFFDNGLIQGTLDINYTLTVYNVHDIENTIDWVYKLSKRYDTFINFTISNVFQTTPFDISGLTPEILQPIYDRVVDLEGYYREQINLNTIEGINHIARCIEQGVDTKMRDKFIYLTHEFDKNRDQCYRDYVHPILAAYIEANTV